MHKRPETLSPAIGAIPWNTRCLKTIRCQASSSPNENESLWCLVDYAKKRGWIDTRFASFDYKCQIDSNSTLADQIITLAKSKLGAPYRYGKSGPDSFDCSGFVYAVYKELNLPIPRTSLDQSKIGYRLRREELRPGDLVFFDTAHRGHVNHSGIYLGGGEFIHATSGRAFRVVISNLDHGFYKDSFRWGIRRIPSQESNSSSPKEMKDQNLSSLAQETPAFNSNKVIADRNSTPSDANSSASNLTVVAPTKNTTPQTPSTTTKTPQKTQESVPNISSKDQNISQLNQSKKIQSFTSATALAHSKKRAINSKKRQKKSLSSTKRRKKISYRKTKIKKSIKRKRKRQKRAPSRHRKKYQKKKMTIQEFSKHILKSFGVNID